jgi:Ca2+-binding RTX toxin-like protein
MCGTAQRLRVLASQGPIEHPSDGAPVREEDVTVGAGEDATLQLSDSDIGGARFVAVMYRDEAGNWGHLASVEVPPAEAGPAPEPPAVLGTPGPGAPSGPCGNQISGTGGKDKLAGTDGGDSIRGKGGADKIKGGRGDDCLRGGRGRDRVGGGQGNDEIHVRGGRPDRARCGPGEDIVVASPSDAVARNCERVKD